MAIREASHATAAGTWKYAQLYPARDIALIPLRKLIQTRD